MASGLNDDDGDGSAVVSSDAISALGSADTVGSLAGLGSTFETGSAVTLLSICFDDGSGVDGSPFKNIHRNNQFTIAQHFNNSIIQIPSINYIVE